MALGASIWAAGDGEPAVAELLPGSGADAPWFIVGVMSPPIAGFWAGAGGPAACIVELPSLAAGVLGCVEGLVDGVGIAGCGAGGGIFGAATGVASIRTDVVVRVCALVAVTVTVFLSSSSSSSPARTPLSATRTHTVAITR